jgi:hypothetical protein
MTAPVCLLDVDGVINLLAAGVREECFAFGCDGFLVRSAVALPARLARLHNRFAIHWFTSWGAAASWELAPLVGLPEGLPVVDLDAYTDPDLNQSRKIPALTGFARDRPLALIDDEIGADMRAWSAQRAVPTILIETHPGRGLEESQVERLLDWAATHAR